VAEDLLPNSEVSSRQTFQSKTTHNFAQTWDQFGPFPTGREHEHDQHGRMHYVNQIHPRSTPVLGQRLTEIRHNEAVRRQRQPEGVWLANYFKDVNIDAPSWLSISDSSGLTGDREVEIEMDVDGKDEGKHPGANSDVCAHDEHEHADEENEFADFLFFK
jgi:hypothetical protein